MKRDGLCLQLDLGNSSAKWRLLRGEVVADRGRYRAEDAGSLQAMLSCADELQEILVSSVAGREQNAALTLTLKTRWGIEPWFASSAAQLGTLKNSYTEPERMGVDRWLAMRAGQNHVCGRFAVVDAGSALTIDIVAADGHHEGGYIIPGVALMERALLLDTDRVRFEEHADYRLDPGKSTAEAVRHGVAVSQAGAVRLVLQHLDMTGTEVLFCGGGGQQLRDLSNLGGLWVPDLVFEGLELAAGDS